MVRVFFEGAILFSRILTSYLPHDHYETEQANYYGSDGCSIFFKNDRYFEPSQFNYESINIISRYIITRHDKIRPLLTRALAVYCC